MDLGYVPPPFTPTENLAGFSPPRLREGPGERLPHHEWDPERRRTLSQRGWAKGAQGAKPPGGGMGDVPPRNLKRGRAATPATPLRVGPKTLANPKPTRAGKMGSRGAKPPGGELWGVCPSDLTP